MFQLILKVYQDAQEWKKKPTQNNKEDQNKQNLSNSCAKFTLHHPSETPSCPRLPINLKVIWDQGEKVENVIKPQAMHTLLFSVLFSEMGSNHDLLQAWDR